MNKNSNIGFFNRNVNPIFIKLIIEQLTPLAIVGFVSVIIGAKIGDIDFNSPNILYMFICFFLLGLVATLLYLQVMIKRIDIGANFEVNTWRDELARGWQGRGVSAYDFCSAVAKSAEKSIVIIGPHFTQNMANPQTKSHTDYLQNGMMAAIMRHVGDSDRKNRGAFKYVRILQVDPEIIDSISGDGVMPAIGIADSGLINHVDKLLKIHKMSQEIEISVYARAYVPSFPSMLIVDERWVFFSIPTFMSRSMEINDPNNLDEDQELRYDFVFGIEDRSLRIPLEFTKVISQLLTDARQVKSLKGNIPDTDS